MLFSTSGFQSSFARFSRLNSFEQIFGLELNIKPVGLRNMSLKQICKAISGVFFHLNQCLFLSNAQYSVVFKIHVSL